MSQLFVFLSLITLIIPPRAKISDYQSMLTIEYGTASNIKSRVNRQSVLDAIKYSQEYLKHCSHNAPENGLFLVSGLVEDDYGKELKITIGFEPPKAITTSLYRCDNKFHVAELEKMLVDEQSYGFVIVDGESCMYATYCGNVKTILQKFTVELPPKHGRGGQSALRFARHRTEAQDNYIRKVSEVANSLFITNNVVNVHGIVFGGSADFKERVSNSDILDQRIRSKILGVFDIQYGGINGLDQTIEQAKELLGNVKFIKEKKIIKTFMDEITLNTGKYIFGETQTMKAFNEGLIKNLIIYENYHNETITDEILENYKTRGCQVAFVSNNTSEGTQFCEGFGGLGGILHYPVSDEYIHEPNEALDDIDLEDLGL